jgi:RimJ/RimL family protein N-acetyltransferase
VSFCYATSETETLWDVSIDTLAAWQGRGLAAGCVGAMVERMLAVGKRPVWGAAERNAASLALARKLGFEPVDRLALVTRGSIRRAGSGAGSAAP